MENPIPKAARSKIYLAGLISGPVMTVVSAILIILLGASSPWIAVVALIASNFLTVASLLARANLGDPEAAVTMVTNNLTVQAEPTDVAE